MVTSELGACEWFVWDLRRSNLLDRGRLDQIVGEFLQKNSRAEPPALAEYLIGVGILTQFQAERLLQGKTQGFVLGPFTLMDALGAGSMGTVYKAQSKTDNNWYAVKVLPRRSMWNVRLARRKVRAFESCQHPTVVPFVDVGTSGGMHYLAWPLVDGETLDKKMQSGKLPYGLAAHYAMQFAEGLDVCHQQGLIHGLVKPSNLMIAPDNSQVYILDFGIGCLLAETEGESLVDTMSTANAVASGLDCASPESIMEPTNLTPAGDQYSLGCTLYYMLTGQYPFPDGTAAEKMMAHQFKTPTPILELAPEVPQGLVDVVGRLLQKTPEQRYHATRDVVDALAPFAQADTGRRAPAALGQTTMRNKLGTTQASVSSRTPPPATPKLAAMGTILNPPTPRGNPLSAAPVRPAAPQLPARPQTMAPGAARPATMQALPTRDVVRNAPNQVASRAPNHAPNPPVATLVPTAAPAAPRSLRGEDAPPTDGKNWLDRIGPIGTAIIATVTCCLVFAVARYFKLL
ncbi:MAG TPA: protein kinase [Gemmataceae bacterium]|jgi:serine/threonine-protein kinase|nr:protein kinase [Gemmataceae bacterium]